jgi:hypothetical protein
VTPPLLVASIYSPSEINADWYALQRRFLARTTAVEYQFKVLLNGVDPAGFESRDILGVLPENEGHARALARLLDHFRDQRSPEAFLILDSDCFPVAPRWHDVLRADMARFGKLAAAPVRTENLDLFPHPSAFYLLPAALEPGRLDFAKRPSPNLLGQEVLDVGSAMQGAEWLLPLLRTNARNVHPVAAAIYHHLFYHHGAGSRDFAFRVLRRYAYCEHWYDRAAEPAHRDAVLAALLGDPEGFVASLMGADEPLLRDHLRAPQAE